jgi:small subunit ribosomal protein S11
MPFSLSSRVLPVLPIPSRKPFSEPEGYFYIHVLAMTRNCIITICDHKRDPLLVMSGGRLGIKHSRRGTPEAAFSVAVAAFEKFGSKGYKAKEIEIVFKGMGKPRQGFLNAISSQQGEHIRQKIVRLTDATPVWQGGPTLPNPKRR